MSTEPPSLQRSFSQRVTAQVFQDEDEDAAQERQPITTRENARVRFQGNQQRAARRLLERSWRLLLAVVVVLAAVFVAWLSFYVYAWVILLRHGEAACDRPLHFWLFIMQVGFILQISADFADCALADSCPGRLRLWIHYCRVAWLSLGIYWHYHAEKCAKTSPELYYFVKWYLVIHVILYACLLLLPIGVIAVIVYGMRHGWFDEMNGARPETIRSIPTVAFAETPFAGRREAEGVGDELEECCCCAEAFGPEQPIKRTPCGHYFHEQCLGQWLKIATTCPLCRLDLDKAMVDSPAGNQAEEA